VAERHPPPDAKFEVDKLLRIRETTECVAFRQWLQGSRNLDESELEREIRGLKAKADSLVQSGPGKVIRFLFTTAIGFIPGAGTVLGTAAGALGELAGPQSSPRASWHQGQMRGL
jgi:hypothetical protein